MAISPVTVENVLANDNLGGNGMNINTNGVVTLKNVEVNHNASTGLEITDSPAASISITNSTFNENILGDGLA